MAEQILLTWIMITFLMVGRNDNYGVNLHKRTAISLNYFASLCSGPDDEIVYVDCSSPDHDTTLTEAIADTLTCEARRRIRTFRISKEQMLSAIGETPLPFSDELSRNVGIRRSNPVNEWILSTNCDVLFHPLTNKPLHDVLRAIPRRFYVCPRVGIPIAQWRMLDRMNVGAVQEFADEAIKQGMRLPPEKEQSWLRFAAVGDFQLAPREQWFEIGGCEEAMKLWGHSDANNSRRLSILNGQGKTPDLGGYFRILHLDHNPSVKVSHQVTLVHNDWEEWVNNVTDFRSHNAEDWGLAHTILPEIELESLAVDPAQILKMNRRKRTLVAGSILKLKSAIWDKCSRLANRFGGKSP